LVILQFTLATFLIIATFTIYSQFNYLIHYDIGYNDKNMVVASGAGVQMDLDKLKLLRTELMKNQMIQNVSADQGGRNITIAHINGEKEIQFDIKSIDENYLPLLQIPIVQGRNFSKNLSTDTAESVLINEAFAIKAGWKEPIGQTVDFFYRNKKFKVIGVVRDYHFAALNEEVQPELLHANPGFGTYVDVYVKLGVGNHADALNYIEKTFKNLFPFHPYQYDYKDVTNAKQYEIESKWKQLILFGAILTIFISCIGLFGLATLAAEKRTKEIGIRKVLGAPVETIVRVLSVDFLRLVFIAAIIASPAAWWAMNAWLRNYPYRISMSVWTFGIASLMVLVVALFTISFQTFRAAMAKPVQSLRTE
jgi:putative ABC transport system permease protein